LPWKISNNDFHIDDYKHDDRGYKKYIEGKGEYKKGYREGGSGHDDALYSRAGTAIATTSMSGCGWDTQDVAYDAGDCDSLDDGRKDLGHRKATAIMGYRGSYGTKDGEETLLPKSLSQL
jgi:hypothetical protein